MDKMEISEAISRNTLEVEKISNWNELLENCDSCELVDFILRAKRQCTKRFEELCLSRIVIENSLPQPVYLFLSHILTHYLSQRDRDTADHYTFRTDSA